MASLPGRRLERVTATVRLRAWLARFPGAPWSAAGLGVLGAVAALLLAGLGARGLVLHGLGWPLVIALLALHGTTLASQDAAHPRRGATRVGFFAYCCGGFPLLTSLIFGPYPFGPDQPEALSLGLRVAVTAASGAFFALWMLGAAELLFRFTGARWNLGTRPAAQRRDGS